MIARFHAALALTVALAALAACMGGEQAGGTADTSARNLTLAPAESMAALSDVPEPAAAPAAPATPAKRPPPPPKPKPAAPATLSLPAGIGFDLAAGDSISSRTSHVGDAVTATVAADVRNAAGRVVIPAGSVVRGVISEIRPAPNPRSTGTLAISFSTVTVRGQEYPVQASVDTMETTHKGRGIEGADAARVGAGAAAGAIAGRLLGKNKKGTVIGGVVGGAVGAGVSAAVKDVDIVLPAGARITVRLNETLTVRAS